MPWCANCARPFEVRCWVCEPTPPPPPPPLSRAEMRARIVLALPVGVSPFAAEKRPPIDLIPTRHGWRPNPWSP